MAIDFEKRAALLRAMESPARLKLLCYISGERLSVGELADRIGLSQSAISQHLAKLRAAKLVKTQKEAQTVYYAIDSDAVYKILSTLIEIFIPPNIALASQ